MYPLTLVRLSKNKFVNIEFKNGKTGRGYLKKCDLLMNLHFVNLNIENEDGSSVLYQDCFVRGTSLKVVQIDSSLLKLKAIS